MKKIRFELELTKDEIESLNSIKEISNRKSLTNVVESLIKLVAKAHKEGSDVIFIAKIGLVNGKK